MARPTSPSTSFPSGTREIFSARRLIRAALGLGLLLLFGSARPAFAQSGCIPSSSQLCLDNTYFVTGDYVVGGVGLRGLGDATGFAKGTISIPDTMQPANPAVPATVPAGATIVAAVLYWETVESTGAGSPTGQQGFFGPANADGSPINSYPITGTILGNPNAPTSWSSGGCSGSSQGSKTMRAYRADVRPYLPLDGNGNIQANGHFQVRLRDSGSNGGATPLTLGATLVIIYRVLSPSVPLNSIVIYDGSVAPANSSSAMTLPLVGFYQAAASPLAKITHIVGNGQANKSEIVSLNTTNLPSLYGSLPPFPGIYNGSWDNPTWTLSGAVKANDSMETAYVTPTTTNSGCVNWGAVIFSTTVPDSDGDGLLDVWKANQNPGPGYVDVFSNQFVALPGAKTGQKDIFIELDYLSNLDGSDGRGSYLHSHLPKQAALDEVGQAFDQAFANKIIPVPIKVHFDLPPGVYAGDPYVISTGTNSPGTGGNAISEGVLQCTDGATLCSFPGTPTVGWKEGLLFVRDSAKLPLGNTTTPGGGFQPGRTLSYHYILFGHALGEPRSFWSTAGNAPALIGSGVSTLTSIEVKSVGGSNVATVTITSPAGYLKPGDCPNAAIPACSDANIDRVTVGGALGQFNLNGIYTFSNASTSGATTTFTINTPNVPAKVYSYSNEPQLAVAYGGPTGTSGHSDFGGGGDSAVTFGLWGADDPAGCQPDPSVALQANQAYCNNETGTVQEQAGTLMHELGHTLALTHGGTYYLDPQNPYVPTYGLNCKPNDLTAMSYLFQIRGFPDNPGIVDYSGQLLAPLDETKLSEVNGLNATGYPVATHYTRWYAPPSTLDSKVGRLALSHCDGTPKGANETAVRIDGSTFSSPIDWNNDLTIKAGTISQDVNFNGTVGDSPFQGINEWQAANATQQAIDLRQIGARASAFAFSGEGGQSLGGGGQSLGGGGQSLGGGGQSLGGGGQSLGGGGQSFGGGGQSLGGGGQSLGGGGQSLGGGGSDQDEDSANSTVDAPQKLTLTPSSKSVVLSWAPPSIGQIRKYSIWRATGSFANVAANASQFSNSFCGQPQCFVQGNPTPAPTTFTDTNVKNNTTYTYFVTDTNKQGAQSGASDPKSITVHF